MTDADLAVAYRDLDGPIGDIVRAVFVLETMCTTLLTPSDERFVKGPEGYRTYCLNKEQDRAWRYMLFHVSDLAQQLAREHCKPFGGESDLVAS